MHTNGLLTLKNGLILFDSGSELAWVLLCHHAFLLDVVPNFRNGPGLRQLRLQLRADNGNWRWAWHLKTSICSGVFKCFQMGVCQNLLLSMLVGWTPINPSYFDVHQGYVWFWPKAKSYFLQKSVKGKVFTTKLPDKIDLFFSGKLLGSWFSPWEVLVHWSHSSQGADKDCGRSLVQNSFNCIDHQIIRSNATDSS